MWYSLEILICTLVILPRYNFQIYPLTNLLFYSISLSSTAMSLQIQADIRKPKRKLSIFLDLPDSSSFSQNPLISTPEKKKKRGSFFSQGQLTQNIQNIPTYSESTFSEHSESAINIHKSKIYI